MDGGTRKVVRGLCLLGDLEDAVYVVLKSNGELSRESYFLRMDGDVMRSGTEEALFPCTQVENDVAAFCAGHGGEYELSQGAHCMLMRNGKFFDVMRDLARGLFPEELVQRAIGAPVRLHVNE